MKPTVDRISREIVIKKDGNNGVTREVAIDPASVVLAAKILMSVIRAYKSCNSSPTQAKISMEAPAAAEKVMVRRAVRRELGFFRNLREGHRYRKAILDRGRESSLEEVNALYSEVE